MSTGSPSKSRLPFEAPIVEMEAQLSELVGRSSTARAVQEPGAAALAEQIRSLRREIAARIRTIYANLSPWETVLVARSDARPRSRDYIKLIFDDTFFELRGDRAIGDDRAIITGLARLEELRVMFIGHQNSNWARTPAERLSSNFGCAHPEGYRKALLKMKLAAKFGIPIITFIDTPGAYPGIEAEERGQASVIAENLMGMSQIDTPIVSVVIGEGGSGGALGIGVADRVAMLEHAYYSVISPEGCASILWKGSEHAPRAAEALKMTSRDLLRLQVIDDVIPEPLGGAHRNPREAASNLKSYLVRALREIAEQPRGELLARRYAKFRCIGVYEEGSPAVDVAPDLPAAVDQPAAPSEGTPLINRP